MSVRDILTTETILPDLLSTDKRGVLEEFAQKVGTAKGISPPKLARLLADREQLGTTGIGNGIAIPHAKIEDLSEVVIGAGISHTGVDYNAVDGKPVYIFFMLLAPENVGGSLHLELLAELSQMLRHEYVKQALIVAKTAQEVVDIIANAEPTVE